MRAIPRIVGILLAAGAGVRFGGGKLLARLPDGASIGTRAAGNLLAALADVTAVVRPGDDALARELAATGATVTVCDDADAGMESIHGGIGQKLSSNATPPRPSPSWSQAERADFVLISIKFANLSS